MNTRKTSIRSAAAMAVAASLALVAGCIAIVADSGYVAPPEIISPKDGATVPTLTEGFARLVKSKTHKALIIGAYRIFRIRSDKIG